MAPPLSIIVPTLNEGAQLAGQLAALDNLRARGAELLVVDGGSSDNTAALAAQCGARVLLAPRGRAMQMNAGAAASQGAVLLFLHADTRLPPQADQLIAAALQGSAVWGRFDVCIDSSRPILRVVEQMMNWRSRLTGISTGDQAVFVRRSAFQAAGGFPEIALMEDIALSRALLRQSRPVCLRETVRTSGRRWEKNGVWRTIWLMWRLRAAYFFGADPARLAVLYGYQPPPR
ncbi:MAG: TIGR04283 family arsenosugar biosynthesis glycosyltransferase [Pseudomonadota bacterium]